MTSVHNRATFSKADIREGLELEQFEVYYQPIINVDTKEIVSGEALVRWNHPRLGFLHPMSFITDAEKTGMILDLGEVVLREACEKIVEWKNSGHPFSNVSVNISISQLSDMDFPQRVKAILKETGAEPKNVTLELTESVAMSDPEVTVGILIELKHIGVRIALDDFGAGYSSLSHMQHFPVDEIKIDGQFIQQSLKSDWGEKLMRSIVLLTRALELDVVVEGVETEEQLSLLMELKSSVVQGFYFTHALPSDEYREWCAYFASHPELRPAILV
jgi:EAL domain-containing protein (putative c-di-GMP-specific phosphodiesterase class I)